MKQLFLKGGAVPLQDPHAHVIEAIQREDDMMQKMHEKEKQYQQQIIQPKSKDAEIDMRSEKDKIKILEKDAEKVEVLQHTYIKYNFPGINKLHDLIHKANPKSTITRDECKTFLSVQTHNQLLKPQVVKKKNKLGHITALFPFETIQMDIVFMPQFRKQNDNYKYFLVIVDVFTRKSFVRPLKDKSNAEVMKEFQSILKEIGTVPKIIMSDNDSTFLSTDFQKLCDSLDIVLQPNVVGDHNYLGIVDRFCRTIKFILAKLFIVNDDTNWIDFIQDVVSKFNDTPNSALDDISPNQALLKENLNDILDINLLKSLKNLTVSDLVIGQYVRLKIGGKFSKSSEPQWSNNIFRVTNINHSNITLDNGPVVRRNNLSVVPNSYVNPTVKIEEETTPTEYVNPVKKAQKDSYIERQIKKDGIERNDDVSELVSAVKGRDRKKTVKYDI